MWRLSAVVALLFFEADMAWAAEDPVCSNEQGRAEVVATQIAEEWPLRDPDALSEYTRKLGARLAQASEFAQQVDWRFHIVRDRSANAFSIGAGYIYITDGALRLARHETEFAAIIAHEMGHQLAGHFCSESPSDGGGMFAWIDEIVFSREPRSRGHVHYQGIGSLKQHIDPVKEIVADRWAASLLGKAGYDPYAMRDVAERVPTETGSVYARDQRRIAAIDQYIKRSLNDTPNAGRRDSAEYRQLKSVIEAEY